MEVRALQPGVKFYDVGLHIETPLRLPDVKRLFLPDDQALRKRLTYGGVDPDTRNQEWQTYCWGGTFSAQEVTSLLEEYAIDSRETDDNQFTFPDGDRVITCLDFRGSSPSQYLNEVTIFANPQIEGLDQETLEQVARLPLPHYR